MIIRAVFFDMGGTIETFRYTHELRLQATPGIQQRLLQAGIDLHLSNAQLYEIVSGGLEHYKRWSIQTMQELPSHRVWREYILPGYSAIVRQAISLSMDGLDAIAEDLMFYIETHYYQRQMRPEMPAVLAAIQQMGLKIGLISNVNSRGQVPTNLSEYGIRHYFDPIVLSSEYGYRKPDPAIFHYAARLANVPTSHCLYVGDRVVRDIDGARRAGFGLAVQIRHDFEHGENDDGASPDAVIQDMNGLLDILCNVIYPASLSAAGQAVSLSTEQIGADANNIRALIFDAGDILYYRPEKRRKFAAFLKELGLSVSKDHAEWKKPIEQQAYRGQVSQEQYWEAVLRLYGITEPEQLERGKQALADDDSHIEFFPGVQETLITLKKQGYLLGIVTDTVNSVHTKLRWFERGGFGHVWDSIISSMELGTRKPDPEIYQAALQQVGLPAHQVAFVGHKASELEGARSAGMKTIAFNYEESVQADCFIDNFPDLLKVIVLN